jgi:hypothetical protein
MRMDPPPSVAWATGTIPAATAAADPPLDPPALRVGSCGFKVGPNSAGSVLGDSPNSGVFVLPRTTSPAARWRCTTTESWSAGATPANKRLPFVVLAPATFVHRSLTRNGTPQKGPAGNPSATARRAWSSIRCTTAFSRGLMAAIASRAASRSSSGFTCASRTKPARAVASYDRYSAASIGASLPMIGIQEPGAAAEALWQRSGAAHLQRCQSSFAVAGEETKPWRR